MVPAGLPGHHARRAGGLAAAVRMDALCLSARIEHSLTYQSHSNAPHRTPIISTQALPRPAGQNPRHLLLHRARQWRHQLRILAYPRYVASHAHSTPTYVWTYALSTLPRKPDVDEDMQWILFHYSGAAAAAGQSYSGAILASATGYWPAGKEGYINRIQAALDRAGIKPWELFMVRCVLRAACCVLRSFGPLAPCLQFSNPRNAQARPQLGRAPRDRPARRGPLPLP